MSGEGERTMRFSLRLPADLHAELEALAEQDTRSLNGEIVYLLRQAVTARKRDMPNDR